MKRITTILSICSALALASACDKKEEAPKTAAAEKAPGAEGEKAAAEGEKIAAAEEAPTPDADAPKPPSVVAFVRHKVADYDKWKTVFDAHEAARRDAGAMVHYVHRDAKDDSIVVVAILGTDAAKMGAFMGSPELKKAMEESGVVGEPEVAMLGEIKQSNRAPEGTKIATHAFIMHEVEDYDAWLKEYNTHADKRAAASIVTDGVMAVADKPNMLGVHLGATDTAKLEAFLGSEELKTAMASAGVKGEPQVFLTTEVEEKAYATEVAAR